MRPPINSGAFRRAGHLARLAPARLGDDPQLATLPLFTEELVVISSPSAPSPAGRRERITVADLEGQPLVMFRPGYDLRETTEAACREAGFSPTFAVEGGEMDAVLELVRAGLGLAVVPRTVAGERFRVVPFAAPGLSRTILLAQRRNVELSTAARALADVLTPPPAVSRRDMPSLGRQRRLRNQASRITRIR